MAGIESIERLFTTIYSKDYVVLEDTFSLKTENKYIIDCAYGQSVKSVPPKVLRMAEGIMDAVTGTGSLDGVIKKTTSSDYMRILHIMNNLEKDGKAAVVISEASATNKSDNALRYFVVSSGLVEAVISLPDRLFSSKGISSELLIISRHNNNIRFVDATDICVEGRRVSSFSDENIALIGQLLINDKRNRSCSISIDEITVKEGCILSPDAYLNKRKSISGTVALGTITKQIQRGVWAKASELDQMITSDPTDKKLLPMNAVQDGLIEADRMVYICDADIKYDKCIIHNGDIIISKTLSPLKIAVADFKDEKVYASMNMYIVTVDTEKADPYYVRAYLDTEEGRQSLQNIATGKKDKIISNSALSGLKIPLKDMTEQKRIADIYKDKMQKVIRIKEELKMANDEMKQVFNHS